MRHAMKDTEKLSRTLIEGVKVYPDPSDPHVSVLLNPDRARPLFHVHAESADQHHAEALAAEYEQKVRKWLESE